MIDKAKIRKAHKVYTNEDGVLMCEMEHSKYLEMQQALTTPTAEEVCKALSEYLGRKVTYNASYQSFNDLIDGKWMRIAILTGGKVIIIMYLPPHLITLIGRFYEGEIK